MNKIIENLKKIKITKLGFKKKNDNLEVSKKGSTDNTNSNETTNIERENNSKYSIDILGANIINEFNEEFPGFDKNRNYIGEDSYGTIELKGTVFRIGTKTPILYLNNIITPGVTLIFGQNGSGKTTLIKNITRILDNDALYVKSHRKIQMSTDKIYTDLGLSVGQEKIIKHKYMIDNSEHILIDEPFANIDINNQYILIKYLVKLNIDLINSKERCVVLFSNNQEIYKILSKIFITYIIKDKVLNLV